MDLLDIPESTDDDTESYFTQDRDWLSDIHLMHRHPLTYELNYIECAARSVLVLIDILPYGLRLQTWVEGLTLLQRSVLGIKRNTPPYSLLAMTMHDVIFRTPRLLDSCLEFYGFADGTQYDKFLEMYINPAIFLPVRQELIRQIENR